MRLGMVAGTKRALWTILVGVLGGAFVGFAVTLTGSFEPLSRLSAALTGAMFGAILAIRVIVRSPGGSDRDDEFTRNR